MHTIQATVCDRSIVPQVGQVRHHYRGIGEDDAARTCPELQGSI
jgi:hypothetical protein